MSPQKVQTLPDRKKTPNKLIVGVAAFLTTGIITASGFAGAATMPNNSQSKDKDKSASSASISAQQDQHSEQAASASTGGIGYGGGNTSVTANVNLAINNSDDNIIQVIFKFFQ